MLKFLFSLAIASGLLWGGVILASHLGWIGERPTLLYPTLVFVFFTTAVIYRYMCRLGTPSHFIQLYLFSMVIKLVAYLAYNIFLVLKDKPAALGNVVFFLIVYFVFTTIEIVFLYRHVNSRKQL